TNVSTETACATCLPIAARSEPSASTATAPAIGSQITMLNKGQLVIAASLRRPPNKPARDCCEAEDHRERIVVEVAGLDVTHDGGDEADRPRAAVHDDAVDQPLVRDAPEPRAEQP